MWHSAFRYVAALGLAGVFAVVPHSVVNAQIYADQYDGYGYYDAGVPYYYSPGLSYYGPGVSYEGPNRERMIRSTGP